MELTSFRHQFAFLELATAFYCANVARKERTLVCL